MLILGHTSYNFPEPSPSQLGLLKKDISTVRIISSEPKTSSTEQGPRLRVAAAGQFRRKMLHLGTAFLYTLP